MAIAESLGLAAVGWVASPIVEALVARSSAYLGSVDIGKGLEDLEALLLPQFRLTIQAALRNSPHAPQLNKWLLRLKTAYYDAEAILHELEYRRLRRAVKGAQGQRKPSVMVRISSHPIIKPLFKITRHVNKKVALLSPRKRELWRRLNVLKEVAAEAKTFRELLAVNAGDDNCPPASNSRPTTSALLTDKVFGRDGVRDDIIDFLLQQHGSSSSTSRYSVVAVTGVGGAGKTTLARYVYNDQRVVGRFGKGRMWLCLSQNIDVTERTKEMIECVSGEKCPDLLNLNVIQNMLQKKLADSEAILLVLDDVWFNDTSLEEKQWDDILAPFASLGGRCKIFITSRSKRFPVALLPGKLIQLSELADTDFLQLFRYYAGLEISNSKLKNDLSNIGDMIAEKMSKSPLAAKVIGNQLRKWPTEIFWQDTLRNVNLSDLMEVLLWSYQRMDVQLQRCFLFCAIYPKGTCYSVNSMVERWVALDFIQLSSNDMRTVEDIGSEYFQLMVDNSIFQLEDGSYIMHDLFHDLAETLSAQDCLQVTYKSEKKIPPATVQHVFMGINNENWKDNLSSICHLSNLRTLILPNRLIGDFSEIFTMISTYFKNIRVLEIWLRGWTIKTLPRAIGDLRNLRFLDIRDSSIEELPDTISKLYHLQFLHLPNSIKILPAKLCNLIKLRFITMMDITRVSEYTLCPIPHVGRLTSLQMLDEFNVRREKGYELQQLGPLRDLRYNLGIIGLENVKDKNEAVAARLIDKPKLMRLKLVWTGSVDSIVSEVDVIEALQPPTNLVELKIDGYMGSKYPTWLQEGSIKLPYLRDIGLYNCNALKVLPSNFSQFRWCSILNLYNVGALRELHTFPENLAKLTIIKCPCLILVCENEVQPQVGEFWDIMGNNYKDILDPELKSFEKTGSMENCPEQFQIIKSAVGGNDAPVLWRNVIRAWWPCHQQRMNFIFGGIARTNKLKLPLRLCFLKLGYCCISDKALSDGLRGMASLQELHLESIMTITTLPAPDVLQTLETLQDLQIYNCWCLRSLGGLHALPRLQKLLVQCCSCFEMDSDDCVLLPPTLQFVTIRNSVFSNNILHGNFPFLLFLEIQFCQVPNSLSFCHLSSLQSLWILSCPSLRLIELSPFVNSLGLVDLPNLDVQSVIESWHGCRRLEISSSMMLNKLLLSKNFVPPEILDFYYSQEEAISFAKSVHLQSIKVLRFEACKLKNLQTTLKVFSALDFIEFKNCPKVSELPELPGSVQIIRISGCPVLRLRCQVNGPDWHKIQHIKYKNIE